MYLYLRANDSFGGGGGGGAPPIVYEAAAAAAGFDGGAVVPPVASTCFSWAMISESIERRSTQVKSYERFVEREQNHD